MGSTASSAEAGRQKRRFAGRYSCDAHGGKAFKVTKASDRITDPRFEIVRAVFERSLNSAGVACVAAAPRMATCCGHCSERSVVAQREALLADFCPQVNNELLQAHGFQCSADVCADGEWDWIQVTIYAVRPDAQAKDRGAGSRRARPHQNAGSARGIAVAAAPLPYSQQPPCGFVISAAPRAAPAEAVH